MEMVGTLLPFKFPLIKAQGTSASTKRNRQSGGPEAVGEGLVSERRSQEAGVAGTELEQTEMGEGQLVGSGELLEGRWPCPSEWEHRGFRGGLVCSDLRLYSVGPIIFIPFGRWGN